MRAMTAVIELTMTVLSAFAMAVMAQLGVDPDAPPKPPASVERVVARSPGSQAPMAPQRASECPEAQAAAAIVV
jgi:hypothetical protein